MLQLQKGTFIIDTIRGRSQTTLICFWGFFDPLPTYVDIFNLINVDKKSTFSDYLSTHLFLSTQFVNAPNMKVGVSTAWVKPLTKQSGRTGSATASERRILESFSRQENSYRKQARKATLSKRISTQKSELFRNFLGIF